MTTKMPQLCSRPRFRRASITALALLLSGAAVWLWAHEGHQPLPARGASVDLANGVIVLSDSARTALDVQTAEAKLQTVEERIIAPATVVAPWQHYAYATSRIEGKIVEIDPPRRLVQTFSCPAKEDTRNDRASRVTWTIELLGDVCKLTLVHDDFDGETATFKSVGPGWNPVLSGLKTLLETGKPLALGAA